MTGASGRPSDQFLEWREAPTPATAAALKQAWWRTGLLAIVTVLAVTVFIGYLGNNWLSGGRTGTAPMLVVLFWLLGLGVVTGPQFWRWWKINQDLRNGVVMRATGPVRVVGSRHRTLPGSSHAYTLALADGHWLGLSDALHRRLLALDEPGRDHPSIGELFMGRSINVPVVVVYAPRSGIVLDVSHADETTTHH